MKRFLLMMIFLVCCVFNAWSSSTGGEKQLFSLDEATRLAIDNNLTIQIAEFDVRIAGTKNKEAQSLYDAYLTAHVGYRDDQSAKTSTIFGTKVVQNDYNFGYTQQLPTGTNVAIDVLNHREFSNSAFATSAVTHDSAVKVTLTQELGKNFFGMADRSRVKLARLEAAINEFASVESIEQEIAQVQRAYWALVLANKRVAIQQRVLDQAKILYDSQLDKIKDGLTEEPELIAAHANYENHRRLLLLAQDQHDAQMNVVKLLLHIEKDEVVVEAKDDFQLFNENENIDVALQTAFEHRRDYKRYKKQIEASGLSLLIQQNNMWPEIDLEGSVKRNAIDDHFNQSLEKVSEEDNPEYYVGLNVRVPVFNDDAEAKLARADYEKAQSLLMLKLLERSIIVDVTNQARRVNVLSESAAQAKLVADLQAKKLAEEEKRFQRGRSDLDTIIRYQKDALSAELEAAEALHDHHVALVELYRQEGVLLDHYWNGVL